jgi:Basic region leucine zipper
MDYSSPVPNPLRPGAKDKVPVPDPLSSFASSYGTNEVTRDMSPSSTMIHLNDHFAGGDSAAFISDDGESMLFLSDFEPTNVLNDSYYPTYPDSEDAREEDHHRQQENPPFPSSSTQYSGANVPVTPPSRESKVAAEMYSYSSTVIVDDDSSKEGRLSPEGDVTLSGEETTAVVSVAAPGTTTAGPGASVPGVVKSKKRKYRTGNDARMNEERKVERRCVSQGGLPMGAHQPNSTFPYLTHCLFFYRAPRSERNREHAKKSRIRKKSFMESMQHAATLLREENAKLRGAIHAQLGDATAQQVLQAKFAGPNVDGQYASPLLDGSRCSESVVAAARELAVKVAMNNLKEKESAASADG